MKNKIICLLLAVVMLFGVFALTACDNGKDPEPCPEGTCVDEDGNKKCDVCGQKVKTKKPNTNEDCEHVDDDGDFKCDLCDEDYEDAWWEEITYDKTNLIFQMTHCSNNQELSSECDRFLAGEGDGVLGEDIDDYVAERNDNAYEFTNVTITYTYLEDIADDYGWSRNYDRIYQEVNTDSNNKPDMYCNFMADLLMASLKGAFANLQSTLRGQGDLAGANYFDAEKAGYMDDLMTSLTLSMDKTYIVASDYFLDIIRAFFIVPVNRALFDGIASSTVEDYNGDTKKDINDFFYEIEEGEWTFERMAEYAAAVYDNVGTASGQDIGDVLGFMLGENTMWGAGMLYTQSSVTIISKTWNKDDNKYDYAYAPTNENFYAFAEALDDLFNAKGVYYFTNAENTDMTAALTVRKQFVSNKVLFGGVIMIGSLEYTTYQDMKQGANGGFGIAPVPVYKEGDKYSTQIHTVGRAGAISDASTKFAQCTAFLQYQSTHSTDILNEYYTYNLADAVDGVDGNVQILKLIRNNVRTSFDKLYEDAIGFFYQSKNDNSVRERWNDLITRNKYQLKSIVRTQYDELYKSKVAGLEGLIAEYDILPD